MGGIHYRIEESHEDEQGRRVVTKLQPLSVAPDPAEDAPRLVRFHIQSIENDWQHGEFVCAPDAPEAATMRERIADQQPIMLSGRLFRVVGEV